MKFNPDCHIVIVMYKYEMPNYNVTSIYKKKVSSFKNVVLIMLL